MADEMMRTAGRGQDGLAKAIQTDNSGYLLTKPAINAIEEIPIFEALEIRDTNNYDKSINLAKYKSVTFIVYNTLDQDITVGFRNISQFIRIWNGTEFVNLNVTLDATTRGYRVILNSALPELNNNFYTLHFRLKCDIAPTAGQITIMGNGELR